MPKASRPRKRLSAQQARMVIAAFEAMLNGECDKVSGYLSGTRIYAEQLTVKKDSA